MCPLLTADLERATLNRLHLNYSNSYLFAIVPHFWQISFWFLQQQNERRQKEKARDKQNFLRQAPRTQSAPLDSPAPPAAVAPQTVETVDTKHVPEVVVCIVVLFCFKLTPANSCLTFIMSCFYLLPPNSCFNISVHDLCFGMLPGGSV